MEKKTPLDILKAKLSYLQTEHAVASDSARKFTISQDIDTTRCEIAEIEQASLAFIPQTSADSNLPCPIPNNLPHSQHFFGRAKELKIIEDALAPEVRSWGVLIDGPGGIGKTALAIRAAELIADGRFRRIIFLSSQARELTADGQRSLENFMLTGYLEILNAIAREIGQPDLVKLPEVERSPCIHQALQKCAVLLVLDNLETLPKPDLDQLFTFLRRLPQGCKAIVTSRRRTDVDARILRLEKLDQQATLLFLAELAKDRPLLAMATETDFIHLYEETGGNPLLLRWIAGQLGRGSCRTIASALNLVRNAPKDNDPLEFVFGDLLKAFTHNETEVLAALTYFTDTMEVKFITELSDLSPIAAQTALQDLSNRALVIPDEEEKNFTLVPMVADFLRHKCPEAIHRTTVRLVDRAAWIIMVNGWQKHELFHILDREWPTLAPALPLFFDGEDELLQRVCAALSRYLSSRGRWDEWLSLCKQAEQHAVTANNFKEAGWRTYQAGYVYFQRQQEKELQACVERVFKYWGPPDTQPREEAAAIRLRGLLHRLKMDYSEAISDFTRALEMDRIVNPESRDVAKDLFNLAEVCDIKDGVKADQYRKEFYRVTSAANEVHGAIMEAGDQALVARQKLDWASAENYSHQALSLSVTLGRKDLIASNSYYLAEALIHQDKKAEALPHARCAIRIYTKLRFPNLENIRAMLRECEG